MDTVEDVVQKVGGEIVSQVESMERAQIDMQITTAKKYPIHDPSLGGLSKVKENMLAFATLDPETAASCFYSLPRGNKTIQGPSVRMAEIAVSCYGNIRVQAKIIDVVSDGPEPHVVVQAVSHDLENNAAISIEKRRRITKKRSKSRIDEDDIQLAVNACTAIAYRDAAFKIVPQALIKPVWQAAKSVAVGDLKSIVQKRAQVMEGLMKMGATEDRILAVIGCRRVEDINVDHLTTLIGIGTALKDGETSLEEAFPILEPVKQGAEAVADKLKNKDDTKEELKKEAPAQPDEQPPINPPEDAGVPEHANNAELKPLRYYCHDCDHEDAQCGSVKKTGALKCLKCLSTNILDREAEGGA